MPGCSWVAAWLPIRHRRRAHVALQVPELLLGQVLVPVDAVHDLQRARLAAGGVAEAPLQPLHERAGLLGEPEPEQRVEREGGVAHPRVAVVPVACAAEPLRQAGGGGGHDRAGRRVCEQLERERRAVHHLAPAPAVARLAQPAPPERHGGVELGGDVGIGVRRRASPGPARSSTKVAAFPAWSSMRARTSPPSTISGGQGVERLSPSSAERNSAPCGVSATSWRARA